MESEDLGNRFIELGQLLKDPKTRISDLCKAAHALGLRIVFRLDPEDDAKAADPTVSSTTKAS